MGVTYVLASVVSPAQPSEPHPESSLHVIHSFYLVYACISQQNRPTSTCIAH